MITIDLVKNGEINHKVELEKIREFVAKNYTN